MMYKPKVSIVIRTKNEENWLKACLLSIGSQTEKKWEIILVDNMSSDKTVEIARSFGVEKIISIADYRPGSALNLGLSSASGEVAVCLSAHCVPASSEWLSLLTDPVLSKSFVACYGRQIPTPSSNADNARDLIMVFGSESIIQTSDCKFHNANSCISLDYWKENPFDEHLTNVEDWYWAKSTIENGKKIYYCADAVVYHHHGVNQHQLSSKSFRAVPVADLLSSLHAVNINRPFFLNPNPWSGLLILSKSQAGLEFFNGLRSYIASAKDINVDMVVTGEKKYVEEIDGSVSIDQTVDFEDYLHYVLEHSEKCSKKIYDYIVFLDERYLHVSFDFVSLNVRSLFEEWVDISTIARSITGITFVGKSDRCLLAPDDHALENLSECLFGQGAALRASVVRQKKIKNSSVFVTKIVDRQLSFKV